MKKGDEGILFSAIMGSPYRFFIAAAVLAAILCLFPARVDAPQEEAQLTAQDAQEPKTAQSAQDARQPQLLEPAGADLSERTGEATLLHRTLYYAPCGHSVQRRENLPARLRGLSRQALESDLGDVIPGAAVTGFSAVEVDIAQNLDIPCPLHWVLMGGEDGMLQVMQNLSGETLDAVRQTDVPLDAAPQEDQDELRHGRIFEDVQALEGYLESLSS